MGELVLLVTVAWIAAAVLISLVLGRAVRIADRRDHDAALDTELRALISSFQTSTGGQAG